MGSGNRTKRLNWSFKGYFTPVIPLTGNPINEIVTAKSILASAGLYEMPIDLVSCPTCGRTKIDLIGLANKVENMVQDIDKDIKVAVMGCAVNGPGEEAEADFGVACGDNCGLLFKKGEIVARVDEKDLINTLENIIMEEYNK